jgi:hypothetical protein
MHTGRRAFLTGALLGGVITLSTHGQALRASPQVRGLAMIREVLELGRRLRRGEITQVQWQDAIGPILRGASIEEIHDAIGLEMVRERAPRVRLGAAIQTVPLPSRLDPDEGAAVRVYFFRAGRTDPPHCHFNQVTAQIVLAGQFRVRHYERLREAVGAFVLRPSHDRVIGVGDCTSISDVRDNAHWHAALTDGVLLDVEQGRLDPRLPIRRRQMVDVGVAPLADGSIVASCLDRQTALRRFG